MDIQVDLTRTRITPAPPHSAEGRIGAWVEFTGIVRGEENGQTIAALEYEAYEPMAVKTATNILRELAKEHPCIRAHVIHRLGIIPVGEAAIWIGVGAAHRREALAMVTAFMDRLKEDVPIWKYRSISNLQRPPDRGHE